MKGIRTYLWVLLCSPLFFSGCNSENAGDCFQTAGTLTRESRAVAEFSTITVFEYLNLVVRQGPNYAVEVESGKNLLNEITAEVIDGRLVLRNDNRCNLFRDYGISTVYVTAPNLTQIRSSTGFLVSSEGALTYPELTLISERFNNPEADATDGHFEMEFAGTRLNVVVNGIAYLKLHGSADLFNVLIAAGDARIEAQDLQARLVVVNHRGSNDLFVDPQERIAGVIRGYGDVIGVNRPAEVEVSELFNGRLRFSSE
jgi:hypothetical protein